MKNKLIFLWVLLPLPLFAANPSFNDFNVNQFGVPGNKVSLKSGVTLTNANSQGTLTHGIPATGNYSTFDTNGNFTHFGTNQFFELDDNNGDPFFLASGSNATVWVGTFGAASGTFTNATFINGFSVTGTPGDNAVSNNLFVAGNIVAGTNFIGNASGLTNLPTTYRSNIVSVVQTFPSATNEVTVVPGGIHYLLQSATPVCFTNLVGAVAGQDCSASVTVSNSAAAAFTNFCTIPAAVYPGQISTNALIVPAGKEAEWIFETRGVNKTNVFNVADK